MTPAVPTGLGKVLGCRPHASSALASVPRRQCRAPTATIGMCPGPPTILQITMGTWVLMSLYSPGPVWDTMSLDPVVFTPAASQVLLMLVAIMWMHLGLSQLELCFQLLLGSGMGSGTGLVVLQVVQACNGGTFQPSTQKVSGHHPCHTWNLSPLPLFLCSPLPDAVSSASVAGCLGTGFGGMTGKDSCADAWTGLCLPTAVAAGPDPEREGGLHGHAPLLPPPARTPCQNPPYRCAAHPSQPSGTRSTGHGAARPPQAIAMVCFTATCAFVGTALRFHFSNTQLPIHQAMLTFVMVVCGTYSLTMEEAMGVAWRWLSYAGIAAVVATTTAAVVLPLTSGRLARGGLGDALEGLGDGLHQLLELLADTEQAGEAPAGCAAAPGGPGCQSGFPVPACLPVNPPFRHDKCLVQSTPLSSTPRCRRRRRRRTRKRTARAHRGSA